MVDVGAGGDTATGVVMLVAGVGEEGWEVW